MPAAESLVCVVIPVYRDPLARAEQAALKQCVSVLHRYPISIVTPERLDAGDHLRCYPQLRNETFPDEFFVSAYSYNKLMLSDAFYARFAGYEYILIHQLDAFVFSDQLQDWCMRGYDYDGAPWVWSPRRPTLPRRLYMGTSPAIAARLTGGQLPFGRHGWDKLHPDHWRPVFAQLGYDLDELLGESDEAA